VNKISQKENTEICFEVNKCQKGELQIRYTRIRICERLNKKKSLSKTENALEEISEKCCFFQWQTAHMLLEN